MSNFFLNPFKKQRSHNLTYTNSMESTLSMHTSYTNSESIHTIANSEGGFEIRSRIANK